MKTIHLLRHAKSSWKNPLLPDEKRPLSKRGKSACEFMAQPISEAGCDFNNVWASPAKRARSTIRRVCDNLAKLNNKLAPEWQVDEELYTFNESRLLEWIQQQDNSFSSVMLVGHNPAITGLANFVGDQSIANVPTCGYVQLSVDVDIWQEVNEKTAETITFLYPRMFDGRA